MTNIRKDQIDQNRRVLTALKEHGDRLETVREINHWAYFRTIAARTLFIEKGSVFGLRLAETTEPTKSKLASCRCAVRIHDG